MATCPNCGNGLIERARLCPKCGRAVDARPSTQEFRIVTVVFCDVVKSTDLERELDPIPMQRLMDRYGRPSAAPWPTAGPASACATATASWPPSASPSCTRTRPCGRSGRPPSGRTSGACWRSCPTAPGGPGGRSRGDPGEAERLAREAVYPAGKTDQLDSRAEAHLDLAEVLLSGGRGRDAEHELRRAISLYQEKGNEVGERNARRLLARTRS